MIKENLTETKERHNKPILPGKIGEGGHPSAARFTVLIRTFGAQRRA